MFEEKAQFDTDRVTAGMLLAPLRLDLQWTPQACRTEDFCEK